MTKSDAAIRVLLVDDHHIVRRGLRLLLESEVDLVVVEAASAEEAVAQARDDKVALVLMDVRLPDNNGLWALSRIREFRPKLPVLMISTYADPDEVEAAISAGANGYLLKDATLHQLRDAIGTATTSTGLYLHPAVANALMARRRADEAQGFSPREREVLELLCRGHTNEELAQSLNVSEKTVKSHLSSIFRKLQVGNRTQAVAKALRDGLVDTSAGSD